MFKLALVPIILASFIVFGYMFPDQPPVVIHCVLEVHSEGVRIAADEIGGEMVPIAVFNNRSFYYQGITHNIETGPFVITLDDQAGYFRPFNEKEKASVSANNLPTCTSAVPIQ